MRCMRVVLLAGALAMTAASPARANGFGWGVLFGALVAAPIISSAYYHPYYYPPYSYAPYYGYSPAYSYAPPVYSAPRAAAAPVWYYCASSKRYYPYTNACPEGWQTVPTAPPA